MKPEYLAFALTLAMGASAQAATLNTLIEHTRSAHPQLESAQAAIEAALKQKEAVAAEANPQLNLSLEQDYAWMKTDFARSSVQLKADWLLWQPALQARIEAADLDAAVKTTRRALVEQALLWSLAKSWSQWQQLHVRLLAERQKHAKLAELLTQIKARYASGVGNLSNVALIQRRLATSLAQQRKLQRQLAQQAARLAAFSGDASLKPEPVPAPALIHTASTEPDWYQTPWLKLLAGRINATQAQARAKETTYKGRLSVFAAGVRNDSGGRFYDDMQGVRIGVQYQLPLYTGGKLEAQTDALMNQVRKLRQDQADQLRTLRQNWQKAQATLDEAPAVEQALQQALKASRMDEDARLALLRAGKISILTVLESLLAQYDLQRDLALNRWQAWEARQQQAYLAGKLPLQ